MRVKAGDVLTIGLDRSVRVLKVIGFAERRGDAAAARVLYEDLQAADGVTIWFGRISQHQNGAAKAASGVAALPLRLRSSCATQTTQN